MATIAEHKKEAEAHVLYEKDKATKIATITFKRLDKHNTATIGMRARFGELVFKANIDDDVKVLVIRGEGDNLGSGGDLNEHGDLYLNPQARRQLPRRPRDRRPRRKISRRSAPTATSTA